MGPGQPAGLEPGYTLYSRLCGNAKIKEKIVRNVGSTPVWQFGSMIVQQYGRTAVWQYSSTAVWQYSSTAMQPALEAGSAAV